MIILLHGDYTEASRVDLNWIKQTAKGKEIRQLDGRNLDKTALTQMLESSSLFGGETLIIIENLFSRIGKKIKLVEELAEIISSSAKNTDIILWEDKEVGTSVVKNLGSSVRVKLFKTPAIIWQFLDGLAPNRARILIPIYRQLIENETPELVLTMIVRRLRQLIQLRDGVTPDGLAGWQASRLTAQARLFTMDTLLLMEKKLLDIEYSIKTGSSPFTLSQHLEQWLISLGV